MNPISIQILQLLEEVKLPATDIENITEFTEHNEYGLAYETLCTQLYEYSVPISSAYYEKISSLGPLMEINPSMWLSLKELITLPDD